MANLPTSFDCQGCGPVLLRRILNRGVAKGVVRQDFLLDLAINSAVGLIEPQRHGGHGARDRITGSSGLTGHLHFLFRSSEEVFTIEITLDEFIPPILPILLSCQLPLRVLRDSVVILFTLIIIDDDLFGVERRLLVIRG